MPGLQVRPGYWTLAMITQAFLHFDHALLSAPQLGSMQVALVTTAAMSAHVLIQEAPGLHAPWPRLLSALHGAGGRWQACHTCG